MKRATILSFLLCLIIIPNLYAAEVKNVTAKQVGNRMLFEYELIGNEAEAEVSVHITVKGQSYPMEKLRLEGDFGRVKPGKAKRISWNVLQDFPRGLAGDVEWEVVAGAKMLKDPVTGMEFIFVKGGCFDMGDTFGDGESDEKPVHQVCVNDFFLGVYEVTQTQWERVMGINPSHFKKGGNYPVERVSWNDIQDFIGRLNRQGGRRYRLPTEAEWEYAARSGGKREKYAGASSGSELNEYAWYNANAGGSSQPVGQKKANGLGLHDMTGNVWEWVADWYGQDYYRNSPKNNPAGPSSGQFRVLRGGSWFNYPWSVRASYRYRSVPSFRNNGYGGFRLVGPSQ
ncbi:MAG: formylglycine-generating enzyme family protein [Proteobacteria bacterium]|nr:formylglycine-generating enzyme family protein [Pseudomonadota bacterium]